MTQPCGPVLLGQPNGVRVRFEVDCNESALRIEAVLDSLGFDVLRAHSDGSGDLFKEVAQAVARRYRLTTREHAVLLGALRGGTRDQIAAELELSRATIDWHSHNVHSKLGVDSREALLRKALRLDDLRWLEQPRRQRDALELLAYAVHELLDMLRALPGDTYQAAILSLEEALANARELAGLELPPASPTSPTE